MSLNKMNITTKLLSSVLIAAFSIIALSKLSISHAAGFGDLTITPTRVIFEERDRIHQVSLINRGNKPATYRISFTEMRMDEHGNFTEIKEPGENELFSSRYIRYSPRQVTLEPDIGQTIRLMVRKPENLPAGEYRSHLLMHATPDDAGMDIQNNNKKDSIKINLTPIFRLTIPIIIRHGEMDAEFTFTNTLFMHDESSPTKKPRISTILNRSGQRSIYGDITISYQSNITNQEVIIGKIKDFVVYTPNKTRELAYDLSIPEGTILSNGKIKIAFSNGEDNILAETAINLP